MKQFLDLHNIQTSNTATRPPDPSIGIAQNLVLAANRLLWPGKVRHSLRIFTMCLLACSVTPFKYLHFDICIAENRKKTTTMWQQKGTVWRLAHKACVSKISGLS